MSNLPQFDNFQQFLTKSFDRLLGCAPDGLKESMRYSLFGEGKRIRPILFLNTYQLFKPIDSAALNFSAGIEAFHTFTLIHDDLPCMDNDDFRRGVPTNHKKFGEGVAVLAGDSLQNLSYTYMLEAVKCADYSINAVDALITFNRYVGADGLMGGQAVDIDQSYEINSDTVDYVYKHKTCDLICAAMECAAILAGASEKQISYVRRYAYNFGYIFQLVDDLLDKDKIGNEKTLLAVYDQQKINALIDKLCQEAISDIEKVAPNVEFFKQLIIKSKTRKK